MRIFVLNRRPLPNGSTKNMAEAFLEVCCDG